MGPVVSILLDRKITFHEIDLVDDFLKSIVSRPINSTKSTREFWVNSKKLLNNNLKGSDCQFSINFDNKLYEMDDDEILEIEILTNRLIQSQIIISAGCNQKGDHNTLGKLALHLNNILDGLVDYCGDLSVYKKGIKDELEGQTYSIEINNGMAENLISDSKFLTNWISHPNFRMIK